MENLRQVLIQHLHFRWIRDNNCLPSLKWESLYHTWLIKSDIKCFLYNLPFILQSWVVCFHNSRVVDTNISLMKSIKIDMASLGIHQKLMPVTIYALYPQQYQRLFNFQFKQNLNFRIRWIRRITKKDFRQLIKNFAFYILSFIFINVYCYYIIVLFTTKNDLLLIQKF